MCSTKYLEFRMNFYKDIVTSPRDMILIAGEDGNEISVHRLIMRASSKYFDALLGPNYVEGTQDKVRLDGIDGKTLSSIVNYCYGGRIELNDNNVDRILAAASRMELDRIEEEVGEYWSKQLTVDNCFEMLARADAYYLQKLWTQSLILCATEFNRISTFDKLNINGNLLRSLLELDYFQISEQDIFTFVMKWIEHNNGKYDGSILSILASIRLKHLTTEFLRDVVRPIYQRHQCLDLIDGELRNRMSDIGDCRVSHRLSNTNIYCVNYTTHTKIQGNYRMTIRKYISSTNQWKLMLGKNLLRYYIHVYPLLSAGKLILVTFRNGVTPTLNVQTLNLLDFRTEHVGEYAVAVYRYSFCPILIGKYIYIFGGETYDIQFLTSCLRFDIEEKQFQDLSPIPMTGCENLPIELKGKIYLHVHSFLLCYDPQTDKWTTSSFNKYKQYGKIVGSFQCNGFLYVTTRHFLHRYDPVNDSWTETGRPKDDPIIVGAVAYMGSTYTLRNDGSFGRENLKLSGSLVLQKKITEDFPEDEHSHTFPPFESSLLFIN